MKAWTIYCLGMITAVILAVGLRQAPGSTGVELTYAPAEIVLPIIVVEEDAALFNFPQEIDPNASYLIYLHGKIIEDQGVDPFSPAFGRYEFTKAMRYLDSAGFHVIAEIRGPDSDPGEYTHRVVSQVNTLINHGVPAEKITVAGFSRGGAIAILTSATLRNPKVNFALLAICGEWTDMDKKLTLAGRILSLYEQSDELGSSCKSLASRSPEITGFTEIEFQTGKQHGTFYTADPAWLDPLIAWMNAACDHDPEQ